MPITTRAAIAYAPNQPLEIREVTLADPGPGEVLIRLITTGLCHSDLHVIDGMAKTPMPLILGHEGLGEVEVLGEGVTDLQVGDRVLTFLMPDCGRCAFCRSGKTNLCAEMQTRWSGQITPFSLDGRPIPRFMAIGSFAERTVVNADMLVKIGGEARSDHACCIACGVTTGLGAVLISAKVTPGSSVAVFGAGGVGLSVVQGARLAGASKIIAIDTNPGKREVALALGATDFIDASAVENVVAEVHSLTGLGADFAFECVGNAALAAKSLDATNPGWGTALCVGVMPTGAEISTTPMNLISGRRWSGSLMGGAKRPDVARFVEMFVAGDYNLDRLVSHHLRFDDINRGFEMMKSGEAVRSVVVFGS